MSTTGLIAELSALLDAEADEAAATQGGGHDSSRGLTAGGVPSAGPAPALTGLTPARTGIEPAPDVAKAEARKAAREALTDEAMKAAADILQVIRQTFTQHGADFDDACKALPLVHKVLEHADKMEAASKAPALGPMLNFVIVLDDTPQQAPPNRRAARFARVVKDATDVETIDG